MPDRPLNDFEKDQIRKYLKQDSNYTTAALWTIIVGGIIAYCVTCSLTQPWPRRGAGGGYGTNIWGPGVAILAFLAVVYVLSKLLRRRTPLEPPSIGSDDPPTTPKP